MVKCQGPSQYGSNLVKVLNLLEGNHFGRSEATGSQVLVTVQKLKEELKNLFKAGTRLMKDPAALINLKVNPKF